MIHALRKTWRGRLVLAPTHGPDEALHRLAAGRIPNPSPAVRALRSLALFFHLLTLVLLTDAGATWIASALGLESLPIWVVLIPVTLPVSALLLGGLRAGSVVAIGSLAFFGVVLADLVEPAFPTGLLFPGALGTAVGTLCLGAVMNRHRLLVGRLVARTHADPVSKLPNRYRLLDDIGRYYTPALALVKAERFAEINSCFGFRFGEKYLAGIRETIERTLTQTLSGVSLYHVDRDTLGILQEEKGESEKTESRFRSIVASLRAQTLSIDGIRFPVPVTAGIAVGTGKEPHLVFSQAEQALTAALYSGRPELFYADSGSIRENIVAHTSALAVVSHAIQHEEVDVVFQPIMTNRGSSIRMYEALIRIQKEDGTLMPPGEFLFAARLSTYHGELTRIVFRRSFGKMATSDVDFSINVSIEDLQDEEFLPFLASMMKAYPRCRGRCVLEITESEGVGNFDQILSFIHQVKEMGYRFAIDDFGSGYSNFANVIRLPVDFIKFDGSIVQAIKDDERARLVLTKMAEIAGSLKIKTVAEFVDSPELLTLVRKLKIDYSQGFLIGAPSRRLLRRARIA
ncbi:MAG: EAL domain-containing protein [Spirochaetota bacterium]